MYYYGIEYRLELCGMFDCCVVVVCSRPYDGLWSKSMVGFGAEDDHFVVELTYNYGVKKYKRGNDFRVGGQQLIKW